MGVEPCDASRRSFAGTTASERLWNHRTYRVRSSRFDTTYPKGAPEASYRADTAREWWNDH